MRTTSLRRNTEYRKEWEHGDQSGNQRIGRIGRVALRIMVERGSATYQMCGINLRNADLDYMVYQVKYDSVFKTFQGTVERDDRHLIINGKKIRVYSEDDAANIPWDDCGAEYIIESTGATAPRKRPPPTSGTGEKGHHLRPGQGRHHAHLCHGSEPQAVHPGDGRGLQRLLHHQLPGPMTKVINDTFGIEQALMSTIHAATAKQKAVDAGRAGTGVPAAASWATSFPPPPAPAKAVGVVIPELKGKMTGMSFRVPTNDVSVVDLTARLKQPASYHDVCVAMENAAQNSMKGIITCTNDQVVSSDLTGFSETCIFDETAGIMLDNNFVKLIAWYDNEWGYTNKILDLMAYMHTADQSR